jgi:hypothetical protein
MTVADPVAAEDVWGGEYISLGRYLGWSDGDGLDDSAVNGDAQTPDTASTSTKRGEVDIYGLVAAAELGGLGKGHVERVALAWGWRLSGNARRATVATTTAELDHECIFQWDIAAGGRLEVLLQQTTESINVSQFYS